MIKYQVNKMRIGELISYELKKQGFTQIELARAIGKSRTGVSQLISGKYNPSQATLDKICDFLNVDLNISFQPR